MSVILDYGPWFLGLLTILVFVHELGHYLAARFVGVHASAFSIGFGPELFGWTRQAWLPVAVRADPAWRLRENAGRCRCRKRRPRRDIGTTGRIALSLDRWAGTDFCCWPCCKLHPCRRRLRDCVHDGWPTDHAAYRRWHCAEQPPPRLLASNPATEF